tara:strand:- start:112 stop:366 length:255 start_codon:yes stop_codon:yes gene_type:complete
MNDPLNASDPKTASHHWYPFLRYQEECSSNGKEATVEGWLRSSGRLNARIEFEEAKSKAAEEEANAAAKKASAETKKKPTENNS